VFETDLTAANVEKVLVARWLFSSALSPKVGADVKA
jgi:hypothetical protein